MVGLSYGDKCPRRSIPVIILLHSWRSLLCCARSTPFKIRVPPGSGVVVASSLPIALGLCALIGQAEKSLQTILGRSHTGRGT